MIFNNKKEIAKCLLKMSHCELLIESILDVTIFLIFSLPRQNLGVPIDF